jgi:hypothetical protein
MLKYYFTDRSAPHANASAVIPGTSCWRPQWSMITSHAAHRCTYPHTAEEFLRHLIRLASQLCEGFFSASQRMDYQLIAAPCASRATEYESVPDSSLASLLSLASENRHPPISRPFSDPDSVSSAATPRPSLVSWFPTDSHSRIV